MKNNRFVFDTNVIISALMFPQSIPRQAFDLAKDDKFLELAVNGSANCIITGDRDLLVLHPFRNINIVLPNEFLLKNKENLKNQY